VTIIHASSDRRHAENGFALVLFKQNLYILRCDFLQIGENNTKTLREATMTNKSHIPKKSFLFERVVPAALIVLGIVTIGLMVFAVGVLLGFVKF
jgi:hypothetical protein